MVKNSFTLQRFWSYLSNTGCILDKMLDAPTKASEVPARHRRDSHRRFCLGKGERYLMAKRVTICRTLRNNKIST